MPRCGRVPVGVMSMPLNCYSSGREGGLQLVLPSRRGLGCGRGLALDSVFGGVASAEEGVAAGEGLAMVVRDRHERRPQPTSRRASVCCGSRPRARSPAEPDFANIADGRIDDERRMRQALVLLAELPPREQDVVVLCAWMELSYEDAALALAVPVGTVRSRLSRARQHLRELDPERGHNEGRATSVEEALKP